MVMGENGVGVGWARVWGCLGVCLGYGVGWAAEVEGSFKVSGSGRCGGLGWAGSLAQVWAESGWVLGVTTRLLLIRGIHNHDITARIEIN